MTNPRLQPSDFLLIRTDANSQIGFGHCMRCLALGQAWQDAGGPVVFVAVDLPEPLQARLILEGFQVRRLSGPIGTSADAQDTIAISRHVSPRVIAVDGYQFGTEYQAQIARAGQVVLVIDDDACHGRYQANFILNQNMGADPNLYSNTAGRPQLLLGTQFTMLRREFRDPPALRPHSGERRFRILITFGGSDPSGLTLPVAMSLTNLTSHQLELVVLVGPGYQDLATLREALAQVSPPVEIVVNPPNVRALISTIDLAISAAGSTVWELASQGVPMLLVPTAENQVLAAAAVEQEGFARVVGSTVGLELQNLVAVLREILDDDHWRRDAAMKGQVLVNADGASAVIQALCQTAIRLRPATLDDAPQLWEWRHDMMVKSMTLTYHSFTREEYLSWLEQKLANPAGAYWIGETLTGHAVGQVRADVNGEGLVELSIDVALTQRGRGFGARLLGQALEQIRRQFPGAAIVAYARPDKTASSRLFEQCGFVSQGTSIVRGQSVLRFASLE